MAAFRNNTVFYCFEHGAAFFGNMAASGEFAFEKIGFKFAEAVLEFRLADYADSFHFDGGKSGSIRNPAAGFQFEKFRMAGGMASAPEFFADFRGGKGQFRKNIIEQAGFSCAGVTAKSTYSAFEHLVNLFGPFVFKSADFVNAEAGFAVNFGIWYQSDEKNKFIWCIF